MGIGTLTGLEVIVHTVTRSTTVVTKSHDPLSKPTRSWHPYIVTQALELSNCGRKSLAAGRSSLEEARHRRFPAVTMHSRKHTIYVIVHFWWVGPQRLWFPVGSGKC